MHEDMVLMVTTDTSRGILRWKRQQDRPKRVVTRLASHIVASYHVELKVSKYNAYEDMQWMPTAETSSLKLFLMRFL